MKTKFDCYCDGCSLGNPGNGGFGVIIVDRETDMIVNQFSKGYINVTNNQMELLAAFYILKFFEKADHIHIITDSQYVCKGITTWRHSWKKNNWKSSTGTAVKNVDMWKEIDKECNKHSSVEVTWVKGHANNKYNEMCDSLAKKAAANAGNDKN